MTTPTFKPGDRVETFGPHLKAKHEGRQGVVLYITSAPGLKFAEVMLDDDDKKTLFLVHELKRA